MINSLYSRKKILLVEDDVLTAKVGIRQLSQKGYIIQHACSGEEAIYLATSPTLELDLILMDIDLGDGIDGTEAAKQILQKKDIPLLFLSSHTEPEVVEKTEQITSYGYVVKNSGLIVLDASIKMAFKLFEAKQKELQRTLELKASENKYRKLFDDHSASKILIDPITGKIVDVNRSGVQFYGYTKEELVTKTIFEISVLPAEETLAEMEKVKSGKKTFFEFQHRLADGSIRDVNVFSTKISIDGKDFLHSIIFDVTEHINEARNWHNLIEYALRYDPTAIAVLDSEFRFVFVSDAYLLDYDLSSIIGKNYFDVFPNSFPKWNSVFEKVMSGTSISSNNDFYIRNNGEKEIIQWHCRPWYKSEKIAGVILYVDILETVEVFGDGGWL